MHGAPSVLPLIALQTPLRGAAHAAATGDYAGGSCPGPDGGAGRPPPPSAAPYVLGRTGHSYRLCFAAHTAHFVQRGGDLEQAYERLAWAVSKSAMEDEQVHLSACLRRQAHQQRILA
jgi:hypothetical protein